MRRVMPMLTLENVWPDFEVYHRASNHSGATLRWYESCIDQALQRLGLNRQVELEFLAERLPRLAADLQAAGLKPGATASYVRAMKCFLSWAKKEGYVRREVRAPRFKERQRVPEPLSAEQVAQLLRALPSASDGTFEALRNRVILFLMLDAAVRIGEIPRMRIGDVYLAEREIRVLGKGDKERVVPMGDTLVKEMRRYLVYRRTLPGDALFVTRGGKPLQASSIQTYIKRLGRSAGVPVHPHKLRHTAAMNMIANGADAFSVQAILGHSTMQMTMRYVHATKAKLGKRHREWSPLDRFLTDGKRKGPPR